MWVAIACGGNWRQRGEASRITFASFSRMEAMFNQVCEFDIHQAGLPPFILIMIVSAYLLKSSWRGSELSGGRRAVNPIRNQHCTMDQRDKKIETRFHHQAGASAAWAGRSTAPGKMANPPAIAFLTLPETYSHYTASTRTSVDAIAQRAGLTVGALLPPFHCQRRTAPGRYPARADVAPHRPTHAR